MIVIAEEKGFFAEQGLEVEVIAPADPSDPPKMAAAGKADDELLASLKGRVKALTDAFPLYPGLAQ